MGGFDRQADATLSFVYLNDSGFYFLPDLKHIFDLCDMLLAELGNVHETIDIILELNEGAKAGKFRDFAVNQIPDLVFLIDFFPRIRVKLFNAEADTLIDFINVKYDCLDFVVLLQPFARMIDFACPAEVRNVDHSVDPLFKCNECTVGCHVANLACDTRPDDILMLDRVPWIRLELTNAERDFLLFFVDAEDNRLDLLALTENV